MFELARLARKGLGLSEVARPIMKVLAAEVGETVLLTRRTGTAVVCLEREETGNPVRLSYERGHVLPVNAGASALVLLAWASEAEVDDVISRSGLPRLTEATVTDAGVMRERLAAIRADGFAVSRGELDPDLLGVAAPIRDETGDVVAAVSVAALSHRVAEGRVPEIKKAVGAAAAQISAQIRRLSA